MDERLHVTLYYYYTGRLLFPATDHTENSTDQSTRSGHATPSQCVTTSTAPPPSQSPDTVVVPPQIPQTADASIRGD